MEKLFWSSSFFLSFFAVPGEPTNLQAKVINSSTVQVSWDPPVDKDQNGIIRGYQIHVQPKNVVSQQWIMNTAFYWKILHTKRVLNFVWKFNWKIRSRIAWFFCVVYVLHRPKKCWDLTSFFKKSKNSWKMYFSNYLVVKADLPFWQNNVI